MSPAALPYSLLLLLAEFATGAQLTVCAVDLRGLTTRSFVKMGAALSAILAGAGCGWLCRSHRWPASAATRSKLTFGAR